MQDLLDQLRQDSAFQQQLASFATRHHPGWSAEDVIGSNPLIQTGAVIGQTIAKTAGIKNKNTYRDQFQHSSDLLARALVLSLAANGMSVTAMERDGAITAIDATVPGNWAQFGGEYLVRITETGGPCVVETSIIFHGQLFAWGEGGRRYRGVQKTLGEAVETMRRG